MQIEFFDPSSNTLEPYRKGQLFEEFTKRLVKLFGYQDIQLRQKRNSLEYDIEAKASISRRPLTGEAKAHSAPVTGQLISSFVGKVTPRAFEEGGLDSLFISTSPITPDGEDYLRTLAPEFLKAIHLSFRTLVGQGVVDFLIEHNQCVAEDFFRKKVKIESSLSPQDICYVVGPHGDIVIATCASTAVSTASAFTSYRPDGEPCVLSTLDLERLRKQLPDLETLEYLRGQSPSVPRDTSRASLPGVLAGAGWFDYKFPSPPECFVGRSGSVNEILLHLKAVLEGSTSVRALQILSRSGVGKSSLLLKISSSADQSATVTVDGRNLLTKSDSRLLVLELSRRLNVRSETRAVELPTRQEDISGTLIEIGSQLSTFGEIATIQVDQFEALLSRPTVYREIVDLISVTTERKLPIVWVLARKNDLAATYDESAEVDLNRLNELSKSIRLEDFSPSEEQALLSRLASELRSRPSSQLTEAILTFSAGFPWLLKRVCAHVISVTNAGVDPSQLARGGLRAEDLFAEDLAGLDEADKAFLRTLAAHLPNKVSELDRRLEGEVSFERLASKLNDFLGLKLLRLSGDVYDTYNDVFKSFLLTNRIPFQSRYVFRVTPGPALGLLPIIAEEGPVDAATFVGRVGGGSTAIYNRLRELRLLGFIDPQPGRVGLSAEAAAAMDQDRIGPFLRQALRANALAARALDLIASRDTVSFRETAELLTLQLPHIQVSGKTWTQYASILINWLRYAGMVDVEGDRIRKRDLVSDQMLLRREFNLGNFSAETFLPSVRPGKVVDLVEFIHTGDSVNRADIAARFGRKDTAALVRDGRSLNLVDDDGIRLHLTHQALALIRRKGGLSERDVAALCLSKPNVKAIIDALEATQTLTQSQQQEVLERFGSANWTEQTWGWRVGILRAWLNATGQFSSGRGGLRVSVASSRDVLQLDV